MTDIEMIRRFAVEFLAEQGDGFSVRLIEGDAARLGQLLLDGYGDWLEEIQEEAAEGIRPRKPAFHDNGDVK